VLKFRVIPMMLWEYHGLVKGRQFNPDRRVGSVIPTVRIYNARDVDELILVDIKASKDNVNPRFSDIEKISAECSVPLTIGGGITSLGDVELLLRAGADKVALNSATYENLQLVTDAAERFGSQCIVASVDYRRTNLGPECFSHAGTQARGIDPIKWSSQLEGAGAGEILLTCIDNDGMMNGFDIPTIRKVCDLVKIPVIASGGAAEYRDFESAISNGGAAAVAAGSIFHFTENTPQGVRDYLRDCGLPVRKTTTAF
jgi:cyclase